MRARRVWAGFAVAVLVAGFGIAGASPASAATLNGTVDGSSTDISGGYTVDSCDWLTYVNTIYGNVFTVTASESGTASFALTASDWAEGTVIGVFDGSYAQVNCIASSGGTGVFNPNVSVSVVAGQDYVVLVWGCQTGCGAPSTTFGTYTLEYTLPGEGIAADAPPIPDWVQAYGRASADATCEDGWDASWQSWAEPVTGGWVCVRSIPSLG